MGIDSDNGSEFINAHLFEWCDHRRITFTRSRPGNKNDGCHVEQKNWTHVRELVGYLRFDTEAELEVLNRIWTLEQNYTNLLLTQQKLITRTRVGAKVVKRHDTAQSPHQRLVAAGVLTPAKKAVLTRARNALHPAHHQVEIARLTTQLQRLALAKTDPRHGPSTGPLTSALGAQVLREATNHRSRGFDVRQQANGVS